MKHIAIPNKLIFDTTLSPSAKRVFLALLTYHWEGRRIRKPIRFIAERAGLSYTTARTAILSLVDAGFVTQYRRYEYSHAHGRAVYATSEYYLLGCNEKKNYTLIPYTIARQLLASHITHATFLVWLGLACKQGQNHSHAYPSLRNFAEEASLSKSTVCCSIRVLFAVQFIGKNHCINRTKRYSCNCYYVIVCVVTEPIAKHSCHHDYHTTI